MEIKKGPEFAMKEDLAQLRVSLLRWTVVTLIAMTAVFAAIVFFGQILLTGSARL